MVMAVSNFFLILSGLSLAIWLVPLAVLLFVVALYSVHRQASVLMLANEKFSTKNTVDAPDFPSDDMVGATTKAVAALTEYARSVDPDFIFGVHAGGRLTSTLVCDALKVDQRKCGFISTDVENSREPRLLFDGNGLSGKILIIDDVVRTGSTLELIRRKLIRDSLSGNIRIDNIFFATLVVAEKRRRYRMGYFYPDWLHFKTTKSDEQFPWSRLNAAVRAATLSAAKGRESDDTVLDIHDRLIRDFPFALFCANLALNNYEKFNALLDARALAVEYDTEVNS